jgi:threonylcarbamoyladenosine tRNA methylthiotransferase MtaB
VRHLYSEIGRRRRVLTETADTGRTEHFAAVRFEETVAPGRIIEATVTGHNGSRLIGACPA